MLHALFDANLEVFVGVRFVEAEYPIPSGRIETLGLDEHNVPVVIEYKKGQDPGAIIQGLFYLEWVRNNRRAFEAVARDKLGRDTQVNWSVPPRLIVVAREFNVRELAAVSQITVSVELKRYSYYGDLLQVDDVTPIARRTAAPKDDGGTSGDKEYTVEGVIKNAESPLADLFLQLRDRILALPEVWEKVGPSYCDYRTTSTFVSANVQPRRKRLLIYIKMGERIPKDPRGATERGDFFGKLNTRFYLQPGDSLDYPMELIKQAYDYVGA